MSDILKQAFDMLQQLPPEDRDRLAWEMIERVEDTVEWDRIVAEPEAQDWMAAQAKVALKKYQKIRKRAARAFISVPQDNLLREESYWAGFDDLPEDIRELAEKNYQLWKDNPRNPGLRFKQIRQDPPIFSFRVGMRHRTVGVETDDGRVAWFWIGSFEHFRKAVAG